MAILPNLSQENEALKAQLAAMAAKLAEASKAKPITMKVTAPKPDPKTGEMTGTSGAISIYGLGRFPITLYRGQWERLIAAVPQLEAFISANSALLATKD